MAGSSVNVSNLYPNTVSDHEPVTEGRNDSLAVNGTWDLCSEYYPPGIYTSTDYQTMAAARLLASKVFQWPGPAILLVGFLGNVLSIVVVLMTKSYRQMSFGFLLCALAITDLGVLATGLLRHTILGITEGSLDVRTYSSAICGCHTFFSEFLLQLSSWTLVLMTLDRLSSVLVPLRSRQIFTRMRIVVTWAIICVLTFATKAPSLWTVELRNHCEPDDIGILKQVVICIYTDRHAWYWRHVWPWLHLAFSVLVPGLIILCANVQIVVTIRKARARRRQLEGLHGHPHPVPGSTGITIMLFSISTLYIIANMPLAVFVVSYHFITPGGGEFLYRQRQVHTAVTIIAYASNAFNFVLYCLCGTKFRKAIRDILCRDSDCEEPQAFQVNPTRRSSWGADEDTLMAFNQAPVRARTTSCGSLTFLEEAL